MHIAILTSGGDCQGLNAVIRGIVRTSADHGATVTGYQDGWKGLVQDRKISLHDGPDIDRLLLRGGTVLGTGRMKTADFTRCLDVIKDNLAAAEVDVLIAIGGEGTLKGAKWLHDNGVPVIGVPKTIDNDVDSTDFTFGFDSAVAIATDAVDRLHTTAESHKRVMVVEVMGRHVGWLAMQAGMAGGAHDILIPEVPFNIDEVCKRMSRRFAMGETYGIIVVAEGVEPVEGTFDMGEPEYDSFGHRKLEGIGAKIADIIGARLDIDVRSTELGYVQRGGTPTAFDRVLATRYAVNATRAAMNGNVGSVVVLRGEQIELASFEEAVGRLKTVPQSDIDSMTALLG